jgi:ABC-type lipoprotein release transport system permease subunit
MLVKLAWRNIFRNRRRTILSGLAIGIGLASLIFTDALMIGMLESMIRAATDTFLGHAQIHASGFRDTIEAGRTIRNIDGVIDALDRHPAVRGYAARTQAFGMISSPVSASSIVFFGIDPEMESRVSKIKDAVIKGDYLSGDGFRKVLVGSRLASNLEVDVGDRVVLTTSDARTGELSQEMFRVGGIFEFGVKEMDTATVFITLHDSRKMLGLGREAHEIAVMFNDPAEAAEAVRSIRTSPSFEGNEFLTWRELMKELDAVLDLSDFTKYILAMILFGIVALIIMNTLFTSLYERLYEFGILRAVGTRPAMMGLLIILEAISLSIISIVFGIITGAAVTYIFSIVGIDYRGIEFARVTFREMIYPVFKLRQYIEYPIWIILFSVAAGIYPAVYAARLMPAKVMRRSM